jgi:hypothetical protein
VVSYTPLPLYPRGKNPGTHWIGGWMDPRAGLEDVEKILDPTGSKIKTLINDDSFLIAYFQFN